MTAATWERMTTAERELWAAENRITLAQAEGIWAPGQILHMRNRSHNGPACMDPIGHGAYADRADLRTTPTMANVSCQACMPR